MSSLRVGATLPTFVDSIGPALAAARIADDGGLDGLFAFDHLWPMGSPGRPALWSFGALAAVAASTSTVTVGPLVARVGLLPDDDLVEAFRALISIAGSRERVIAALGAGDRLSAAENVAYGVAYPPAGVRLAHVGRTADRLAALGLDVWIGGNSDAAAEVAAAHAAARNLWGLTPEQVAKIGEREGHVPPMTWAGQVLIGRDESDLRRLRERFGDRPGLLAGTVGGVAADLTALGRAGASWCVCAPLDYLAEPERSIETVCLVAEAVR